MAQPRSATLIKKETSTTKEKNNKKKDCSSGCSSETIMASSKKNSRIIVHYDCGFPNTLYIRGSGNTLSWNKGTPMTNMGPNTWLWETDSDTDQFEFKVLVNDEVYESGENHCLKKGNSCEYSPYFNY